MKPGMKLMRELALASAKVLHNTHVAPKALEFKFELIAEAYGHAAVVADFTAWCQENAAQQPHYPITDYMKLVDERLGGAPEQKRADTEDPRIKEISTRCYELTGWLPPVSAVADLLLDFPPEEINAALKEYSDPLTEKEVKVAMKQFFSEGGAVAVILARRRRK